MVDRDRLERLLIDAARQRRTMTYQEVLGHFGRPIGPVMVRALCADLGHVCRRLEPLGLRDIACIVVRKSDGLPGAGYFAALHDEEGYDGPCRGSFAQLEIERRQQAVFAIVQALEIESCAG